MSESAASKPEFSDLWRNVFKLCDRKIQDKRTDKKIPGSTTSAMCKDLQSPKGRGCSRYPGLNNGDSPGDVEPSQDIFWDSTSPTPANPGLRNTRVVEISDIVNRIAPKDMKRKGIESPLLQWIGDSAIPGTPDGPRARVRKKFSLQNSVDDLVKLARQFDKNMQQDNETSEECYTENNNLTECENTSKTNLTETSFPDNVKDLKCPSSSDQVEAELNALFDCSTQTVSGRLSQGSASAPSKEVRVPAAHPDQEDESCAFGVKNFDDFDDDWENDDLLNDSFVLTMTQNPDQNHDTTTKTTLQVNTKTNTTEFTSACKPSNTDSAQHQSSDLHYKPSCSTLQELCFKPKTTNRHTFKLGPAPHVQPNEGTKKSSSSSFTVIQPKLQIYEQKSATTKTLSTPHPDKITNYPTETCVAEDIIDSLWDDGDDNALLYQVCDSVERISNTQPQLGRTGNCQEKQDAAVDTQRGTTTPLPIDTAWSMNDGARARRQSPCAFVCSNSLPGTSCEAVNYQGWNVPMKGANNNSRLSQSLPGTHTNLGAFNQCRDSSGNFQTANATVDMKPHTVTARGTRKSYQTAFKRSVSDLAVMSNKVFVTSQMTGKCSAAEIERKKQEALARRRLRMQNVAKK